MHKNTAKKIEEKIKAFLEAHALPLLQSETILVALSGGADSIFLSYVLKKMGVRILAAHVNFQLRGAESDADEKFVKDWCKRQKIALKTISFETKKLAKANKSNIEQTARLLRYNWFEKICREKKISYLATAHHLNDHVESILLHIVRGSGLPGAKGIQPVSTHIPGCESSDIELIRPLLQITKDEIISYLSEKKISFVTDSTNLSNNLSRNRIRNKIIPQLKNINPQADIHIAEFGFKIQELLPGIESIVQTIVTNHIQKLENKFYFKKPLEIDFTLWHDTLRPFAFNEDQLKQMYKAFAQKKVGKIVESRFYRAYISSDQIEIAEITPSEKINIHISSLPYLFLSAQKKIEIEIVDKPTNFDDGHAYIRVTPLINFTLRNWQPGDTIKPLGMQGKTKKIQDLLTDKKIQSTTKENALVLLQNEEIIWVSPTNTISEKYKLKISDTQAIRIKCTSA